MLTKRISLISFLLFLSTVILVFVGAKSCVNRNNNKAKIGSSIPVFTINAPSSLTATTVSSNQINLSWQDNANNEDGFEIWRSYNTIAGYSLLAVVSSNIVIYSDTSVTPSNNYYYRIRAFNTIGDYSNYSNIVSAGTFVWNLFVSWMSIAAGGNHSLAIDTAGNTWSWGRNNAWQLGLGDNTNRIAPERITRDFNGNPFGNARMVTANKGGDLDYTFVLRTDPAGAGTVWGCGWNELGQLGLGYTESPTVPDRIRNVSDWFAITAGNSHSLGLKTGGTLWAWGFNYSGQLGLGDTGINRITPTQVTTSADWAIVMAGGFHSLGIKTNGVLWTWGFNEYGQLGLGDYDPRSTPTQISTEIDWSILASGWTHTLAIKTNRTLWAWGNNNYCQLGMIDMNMRNTPTQVTAESDWSFITGGNTHVLALKTAGTLWGWGENSLGQLGLGDTMYLRFTPTQITTESDWLTISGGRLHSLGLKTNGILWVWGWNGYGQLGMGDLISRYVPCRPGSPLTVSGLTIAIVSSSQINLSWTDSNNETGFIIERKTGVSGTWEQIAVVGSNIISYSDTGLVLGTTYYYRVIVFNGLGNSPYSVELSGTPIIFTPTNLALTVVSSTQINLSWQDNSSDETGFKIERKTGSAGTYGDIGTVNANVIFYSNTGLTPDINYYYRIKAYNISGESAPSNEVNATPTLFAPISLSANVLSSTQISLSWIDNTPDEDGFIIERKRGNSGTFQEIGTINANITSFDDITETGFALDAIYYYRVKAYNELYDSLYSNIASASIGGIWVRISAGSYSYYVFGLKTTGALWAWGNNDAGQLGDGTTTKRNTPGQIGTASDWVNFSVCNYHSSGIKTTGTLWGWGNNDYGQLGFGDSLNRKTPTQLSTETNWSSVAVGSYYTLAIKTPGTLWGWGYNEIGQLGLGDTEDRATPSQVTTETIWAAVVASGNECAFGLKTTGTLWAWGFNLGQLGIGDTINRRTPSQIGTSSDWSIIFAGTGHALSRKINGTIWSWGNNNWGQLGLGDNTERFTPAQIGMDSDWSIISAGDSHTLSRKTNGTLWAWGYNYFGQLGIGKTGFGANRTTPTQIGIDSDWSEIGAGVYQSFCLKTNGTLWAWGYNEYGQLGLGDTIDRIIPTLVGE